MSRSVSPNRLTSSWCRATTARACSRTLRALATTSSAHSGEQYG